METHKLSNGHIYLLVDTSVQGGDVWTANKHPELSPTDLFYASLFMGIGGVLALLFTLYPVVIILSDKQMQQVFCYFLLSSCIANTSLVLIIMFYCIPSVVYKIIYQDLQAQLFGNGVKQIMGGLFLYIYYVTLLTHFLMSFNRFFAIVFHIQYAHTFKKQNVYKMIAATWLIVLPFLVIVGTQLGGCIYVYHEEFTIFSYGLTGCSYFLRIWDIAYSGTIVIVTLFFDMIVAVGLMKRALKNKTNKTIEIELSFFIQTILTGMVYFLSTGLYHFAGHSFKSEDMWRVFFFDQFPKLCAILLIGIFCVTLQKRIREKFKEHFLIFCCLVLKEKEVEEFEFVLSRLETSVTLSQVESLKVDSNNPEFRKVSKTESSKEKEKSQ